jgi:hypothetical protein
MLYCWPFVSRFLGVRVNAILDRLKDSRPDNIVLILGGKLAIYHGVNLSVLWFCTRNRIGLALRKPAPGFL